MTAVLTPVAGPAWSESGSGTYPGRFPLSVERHIMSTVERLVPGVTTVTLNARYYALHGLVIAEARDRGLEPAAAQDLMRRAEVALGAVSARHLRTDPNAHRALSVPHGHDIIARLVDAGVDVSALAAQGAYAQPSWGFWAAYRGSEALLQITSASDFAPGEHFDPAAVRAGLNDVFSLTDRDVLRPDVLDDHAHLCICKAAETTDGEWLARLLAQPGVSGERETLAWTRRETLRVLARCSQLTPIKRVGRDLPDFLAYHATAMDDAVLAEAKISAQWRGVILRNYSVEAWRDMWAWLVNEGIRGLTPRSALGEMLAAGLDDQTVGAFMSGLPATRAADGRPAPAEVDASLWESSWATWYLGVLLIGARRSRELTGHELEGFQGHKPEDVTEELAPAWLADQADRWRDRPVREFARWLTEVMLNRSQRLALRKARPDARTGQLKIPSRVHLRDGFIFRDSDESGGPASLRLDQLAGVLAGAGLLATEDGTWVLGPRGDLIA